MENKANRSVLSSLFVQSNNDTNHIHRHVMYVLTCPGYTVDALQIHRNDQQRQFLEEDFLGGLNENACVAVRLLVNVGQIEQDLSQIASIMDFQSCVLILLPCC